MTLRRRVRTAEEVEYDRDWLNPILFIVSAVLVMLVATLVVVLMGLDRIVALIVVLLVVDALIAGVIGYQWAAHVLSRDWEVYAANLRAEVTSQLNKEWEDRLASEREDLRYEYERDLEQRLADVRRQVTAELDQKYRDEAARAREEGRAHAAREWEDRLAKEREKAYHEAESTLDRRVREGVEKAIAQMDLHVERRLGDTLRKVQPAPSFRQARPSSIPIRIDVTQKDPSAAAAEQPAAASAQTPARPSPALDEPTPEPAPQQSQVVDIATRRERIIFSPSSRAYIDRLKDTYLKEGK